MAWTQQNVKCVQGTTNNECVQGTTIFLEDGEKRVSLQLNLSKLLICNVYQMDIVLLLGVRT